MPFDIRQLRYGIAAADHGSFYRAPRTLDIEQSTLNRIAWLYRARIEAFSPRSKIEAMRVSEQIKSVSPLFNALAGGSALAVSAAQLAKDNPNYGLVVLTLGVCVWVHTMARDLLGFADLAVEPAHVATPSRLHRLRRRQCAFSMIPNKGGERNH